MSKTVSVIVNESYGRYVIEEIDELGNIHDVMHCGTERPTVGTSGTHAVIRLGSGVKYLYDFSAGFGRGTLRGI